MKVLLVDDHFVVREGWPRCCAGCSRRGGERGRRRRRSLAGGAAGNSFAGHRRSRPAGHQRPGTDSPAAPAPAAVACAVLQPPRRTGPGAPGAGCRCPRLRDQASGADGAAGGDTASARRPALSGAAPGHAPGLPVVGRAGQGSVARADLSRVRDLPPARAWPGPARGGRAPGGKRQDRVQPCQPAQAEVAGEYPGGTGAPGHRQRRAAAGPAARRGGLAAASARGPSLLSGASLPARGAILQPCMLLP